jgi:hypothetical protein
MESSQEKYKTNTSRSHNRGNGRKNNLTFIKKEASSGKAKDSEKTEETSTAPGISSWNLPCQSRTCNYLEIIRDYSLQPRRPSSEDLKYQQSLPYIFGSTEPRFFSLPLCPATHPNTNYTTTGLSIYNTGQQLPVSNPQPLATSNGYTPKPLLSTTSHIASFNTQQPPKQPKQPALTWQRQTRTQKENNFQKNPSMKEEPVHKKKHCETKPSHKSSLISHKATLY